MVQVKMTTVSGKYLTESAQRGLSLIEAMVAALILAILFLGIAHVLSRGLVSQRYMNTQNLALLEIREKLQTESDFCTTTLSLTWLGKPVSLDSNPCGSPSSVNIAVGGTSASVTTRSIDIRTTENDASIDFFGGDGVIRVSDNWDTQ